MVARRMDQHQTQPKQKLHHYNTKLLSCSAAAKFTEGNETAFSTFTDDHILPGTQNMSHTDATSVGQGRGSKSTR